MKLPPKYQKALDLILHDNSFSIKQIAQQVGLSPHTLYGLVEGKEQDSAGKLFYETLQKHEKQRDKEIRDLVKKNKKLCQRYINEYLAHILRKSGRTKEIHTMTTIANALSKSTPNVEIGSFTYQKGLSPEDIYAEFKRLTGLTSERRAVSGTSKGGTGKIPVAPRPRTPIEEEPENPDV
jgi:AraC-like DNA-binding protein